MDWDPRELNAEERRRLHKLLQMNSETIERLEKVAKQDARMEWLWAALRRVASTVAIILGAIVLMYEQIKSFIRSIVQ